MEAASLPANAVTTSCNATSRHGLGIVEKSYSLVVFAIIIIDVGSYLAIVFILCTALRKLDSTVTFYDASSGKKTASIRAQFSV